jgi:hypothetical protein
MWIGNRTRSVFCYQFVEDDESRVVGTPIAVQTESRAVIAICIVTVIEFGRSSEPSYSVSRIEIEINEATTIGFVPLCDDFQIESLQSGFRFIVLIPKFPMT